MSEKEIEQEYKKTIDYLLKKGEGNSILKCHAYQDEGDIIYVKQCIYGKPPYYVTIYNIEAKSTKIYLYKEEIKSPVKEIIDNALLLLIPDLDYTKSLGDYLLHHVLNGGLMLEQDIKRWHKYNKTKKQYVKPESCVKDLTCKLLNDNNNFTEIAKCIDMFRFAMIHMKYNSMSCTNFKGLKVTIYFRDCKYLLEFGFDSYNSEVTRILFDKYPTFEDLMLKIKQNV